MKHFIRSIAFITLGVLLFWNIQQLLSHKWKYPNDGSDRYYAFSEYYDILKDAHVQALFLGTSHTYNAIDPMEIYQQTGIVTFELGSASQPMEASRYVLEDALERSKPEYVFLDPSILFRTIDDSSYYRWVLDNMKFGPAKIKFALAFANRFGAERFSSTLVGAFLPIYRYHSRWNKLVDHDFPSAQANLYRKGYYEFAAVSVPATIDVDIMNANDAQGVAEPDQIQSHDATEASAEEAVGSSDVASAAVSDGTQEAAGSGGEADEVEEGSTRDSVDSGVEDGATMAGEAEASGSTVMEENLVQLLEMKRLCEQAGTRLFLFKVPSLYLPQEYVGAWTLSKSKAIKALSEQYDIPFLDLMYDVDLSLDWDTDTVDGGMHLNIYGAKKVSDYMAAYLRDVCGLKGGTNRRYEEDLPIHNDVARYARLVCTRDMASYLEELSKLEELSVFFSASGDMRDHLKLSDMAALNAFGLETDFEKMAYGDAYLAVMDGGRLLFEASSDTQLEQRDELEYGLAYQLSSSGLNAGGESRIKLNGKEYSLNKHGLNIVVYNRRSRTVLDCLCFDTGSEDDQTAVRNHWEVYLRRYSDWRAKEDYRQGIR